MKLFKKKKNTPVVIIKKVRRRYHKLFFVIGAAIGGAVGFNLRKIVDKLTKIPVAYMNHRDFCCLLTARCTTRRKPARTIRCCNRFREPPPRCG